MNYLALCCIVRDETPFLREWLAYHALLGVESFYLYDNMSATPVAEALGDFIDGADVTILPIEGQGRQMPAYQDCLRRFGQRHAWVGFIDVDEFVCPLWDKDLRVLLGEFEDAAALAMNWNLFSSNGYLGRPAGLVTENYTRRFPYHAQATDIHIKSFVRPHLTVAARNPHYFQYAPGHYCVNAAHFPVVGTSFSFSHYDMVKLNHYFYRSQQDFEEKIRRGNADNNPLERSLDMFYRQATADTEDDKDILRFLPPLLKALRKGSMPRNMRVVPEGSSYADYMSEALTCIRTGRLDKGAVILCHASLEYGDMSDVWVTRAIIARLSGHLSRAYRFLLKAASLENSPLVFRELAALRRAQGQKAKAQDIECFMEYRGAL